MGDDATALGGCADVDLMTVALDLGQVQGNVLTGYGSEYRCAIHVGLCVPQPRRAAPVLARWLREVSFDRGPGRRGQPPRSGPHLNLAFSWEGLARLGVDPDLLYAFPEDFATGARKRAGALADDWPTTSSFESADLLLTVHAASMIECEDRVAALLRRTRRRFSEVYRRPVERTDPPTREAFGFADGCSQPAIEDVNTDPTGDGVYAGHLAGSGALRRVGRALQEAGLRPVSHRWRLNRAGEFLLGHLNEDGELPEGPPAPLGPDGTFMVYREIDQHEDVFEAYLREHAPASGMTTAQLAAKIVGRTYGGAPLARGYQDDEDVPRNRRRLNDFRYGDDPHGFGCPLGAHVRRANPRDALPGGAERTMRHRIIRRGMPYAPTDDSPAGLAFTCFSASISQGFEFIQREWLNTGYAFGLGNDPDFLLQQPAPGRKPAGRMVLQGAHPIVLPAPPEPFVTVRGCEYLFVPSRRACEWLAAIQPAT
jgi:deferrochelatase/peroxidase EfeB